MSSSDLPWYLNFMCGGLAACVAELITLPIDTAKVRLQIQKSSNSAQPSPTSSAVLENGSSKGLGISSNGSGATIGRGLLGTVRQIAIEEGPAALYKGLWPGIHRQLVFASLRIGIYGEIMSLFKKPGETTVSLDRKIIAGLLSGAIGMTVANPTDLVKIRFQSEGRLLPGQKPRYSGVLNAYSTIIRTEGVLGLWTGFGPAVARNSLVNATELATYDTAKEFCLGSMGMKDDFSTHVTCGIASGAMATIIANPVDVVKTRVMASRNSASTSTLSSSNQVQYTGALDCFTKTLRNEGPTAFYKGVFPQFLRITGWNIIMFVTLERLKKLARGGQAPML